MVIATVEKAATSSCVSQWRTKNETWSLDVDDLAAATLSDEHSASRTALRRARRFEVFELPRKSDGRRSTQCIRQHVGADDARARADHDWRRGSLGWRPQSMGECRRQRARE